MWYRVSQFCRPYSGRREWFLRLQHAFETKIGVYSARRKRFRTVSRIMDMPRVREVSTSHYQLPCKFSSDRSYESVLSFRMALIQQIAAKAFFRELRRVVDLIPADENAGQLDSMMPPLLNREPERYARRPLPD